MQFHKEETKVWNLHLTWSAQTDRQKWMWEHETDAENSTSASVSHLADSGQGLSFCDYCFLPKMLVGSVSRRPPPGPRLPRPISRTALTDGRWQLRYWGVSKVQINCGPAKYMEAKRRPQAASAQILLLPTTELPPILKCTLLPLGYFFKKKKKTQLWGRVTFKPPPRKGQNLCWDTILISTERSCCPLHGRATARAWSVRAGRRKGGCSG